MAWAWLWCLCPDLGSSGPEACCPLGDFFRAFSVDYALLSPNKYDDHLNWICGSDFGRYGWWAASSTWQVTYRIMGLGCSSLMGLEWGSKDGLRWQRWTRVGPFFNWIVWCNPVWWACADPNYVTGFGGPSVISDSRAWILRNWFWQWWASDGEHWWARLGPFSTLAGPEHSEARGVRQPNLVHLGRLRFTGSEVKLWHTRTSLGWPISWALLGPSWYRWAGPEWWAGLANYTRMGLSFTSFSFGPCRVAGLAQANVHREAHYMGLTGPISVMLGGLGLINLAS